MKDEKPTCLNCAHAAWQMTAHKKPRIKKNYVGKCLFDTEPLLRKVVPNCISAHDICRWLEQTLFPESPYYDCPQWKAKSDENQG